MKRIPEFNQQDGYFDLTTSKEYLDEVKSSSQARYRNFISNLKKLKIKGRYLDVGCGPGIVTQKIARQHPDVEIVGNDNSAEMLKLAQQELPNDLKDRIRFTEGDACKLDTFKELGKFDLIYSTFTMHHWDNAELAIKNLFSLINDNGLLYIHDLKRVIWLYYIKSNTGFFKSIRASYRPKEIKKMLIKIGIKNFSIRVIFPFFMQAIIIRK